MPTVGRACRASPSCSPAPGAARWSPHCADARWHRRPGRPESSLGRRHRPRSCRGPTATGLSELRLGVLAAEDHATRATRLTTLEAARRLGAPLTIDEAVGDELARLRVALKAIGRAMKVMDVWIAATAMAHHAAVCTQDADFDAAAEAGLLDVVRV
jgi:predicted nucleic acid-binding protein